MQYSNTYYLLGPPSPFIITPTVTGWQSTDVSGTAVTNGITYNVYAFKSTSAVTTYTLTYTSNSPSYIYVLAVGGGGSGGSGGGGGGGAGGVVMNPIYITGSGTISISIGAGGATTIDGNTGNNGNATTVNFSANSSANVYAYGGGAGGNNQTPGKVGGSGGGASYNSTSGAIPTLPINNFNNYGNYGGYINTAASSSGTGGGGGAGTAGFWGRASMIGGFGGDGIQCNLPGIKDFTPSGTSYGTYYWGGGGGAGSSSGTFYYKMGYGGLGGGGGGANASTPFFGIGGTGGINPGNAGAISQGAGGAGGANTGGGGGGAWNGSTGPGGSGMVVIAFPQISLLNNIGAILPTTFVSSSSFSAVLNNTALSTSAYNTIKGAYACRLLNYNYFGPIMTLRYSTDTTGLYTQNFYSDICGNMGTGYLGTGQSVSSWLSANNALTSYAYVTKWYNQGMDTSFNSAYQYAPTNQPIYDVSNGVINYGYTGGIGISSPNTQCYLFLPNGAFPYGNSAFTYSIRWYNFNGSTATGQSFFEAGTGNGMVAMYYFNNPNYQFGVMSSISLNSSAVSYLPNSSWTITYDGTTNAYSYVAGTNTFTSTLGARSQVNTNNQIGGGAQSYYGQIQMCDFYVFSTAISSADRLLVEATPSTFNVSAVATITSLSTRVTATTFILNWSAVANATSYALWINGSYFATYGAVTTTGTVTPVTNSPWDLTFYAYNSSNILLARGSTTTLPIPVMYYPFNNDILNYATGTAVNDLTGSANFVNSNPSGTGYSHSIAGSSTYCLLRSTAITLPSTVGSGFTIAFWLNSNTTSTMGNYVSLFGFGQSSTSVTNGFYIQNTYPVAVDSQFQLCYPSTNTYILGYNNSNFLTIGWQHLAFVWTVVDSAYNFKLDTYSNSTLVSTIHGTAYNTNFLGNCAYQRIGHRTDAGDSFFSGYLANWMMYTQPLTPNQVNVLYRNLPFVPNGISQLSSNGTTYKIYICDTAGITYKIDYSLTIAGTAYALVVGGGGCGGIGNGGGGGGGEVVMQPVSLSAGSGSVNVSVGAGAVAQALYSQVVQIRGGSSTVTGGFSITAIGGGYGGTQTGVIGMVTGGNGGSGGGGYYNTTKGAAGTGVGNTPTYHFGNNGGTVTSNTSAGGGGGAGAAGGIPHGGAGIITSSTLYGIKEYGSFSTYYWGGGGGGCNNGIGYGGNGGIGGGGGGSRNSTGTVGTGAGGGSAINSGSAGFTSGAGKGGGDGGANTGGGGGGSAGDGNISGAGGSGIVVLAIPVI